MKVQYWAYSEVKPDGTFDNDPEHKEGAVRPQPEMATSGHWMSVSTGRLPDGTMHGITIYFKDEDEMRQFEQTRIAEL